MKVTLPIRYGTAVAEVEIEDGKLVARGGIRASRTSPWDVLLYMGGGVEEIVARSDLAVLGVELPDFVQPVGHQMCWRCSLPHCACPCTQEEKWEEIRQAESGMPRPTRSSSR